MSKQKLAKLNYIDAIRGIAIIMVVMHHAAQQGTIHLPHILAVFLSLGTRGVQLFFIASAFTLFRSYQYRSALEKQPTRNFFIRRIFRIAPAYYLAIIYYTYHESFGGKFWFGAQPFISVYNTISNILFVHGVSPYWINSLVPGGWSITVEMMFYTIFPLLFLKIKTIKDAFVFLIFSLLFKIIIQEILIYNYYISSDFLWKIFLFYYFPSQLPIFALGIIMYFLIQNIQDIYTVSLKIKVLTVILIALQIGTSFNFLFFNHIVFGVLFVLFGIFLSNGKLSFLSISVIRYIGKISYSMYILHFIVISWLSKFNLIDFSQNYLINYVLKVSLILVITITMSTISYKLIEEPFQKIAKKLILKLEAI